MVRSPKLVPVALDAVPEHVRLRPVLSAWSPVAAATEAAQIQIDFNVSTSVNDQLWKRLCEYVARAEQQLCLNDNGLKLQRMCSFRRGKTS